jgi:hypothetical protein
VARELLTKTKWIASKGAAQIDAQTPFRTSKLLRTTGEGTDNTNADSARPQNAYPIRQWRQKTDHSAISASLTNEPERTVDDAGQISDTDPESKPRSRMFNVLHPKSPSRSRTRTTTSSEGSSDVRELPLC